MISLANPKRVSVSVTRILSIFNIEISYAIKDSLLFSETKI